MSEQPKVKTFRDKRRPTPINVDIAKRGPGLSTPDVQDVQTPVLQKLLIQNQLGADTTTTTAEVKQESTVDDSNPPSVNSATSSDNMSQEQDQATVVKQSENDNENGQPPMVQSDNVLEVEVANVANVLLKASGNLQAVTIPTQPIDMDTIEVEKQDRKRQRNRIAATKCRKRKIERITQLEHEVRELNDQLQKRIKAKRELEIEVDEIRNRLKIHIKQGCSGLEEYLQD
jgi:hypothetical protein